jgi:hypothetical protein
MNPGSATVVEIAMIDMTTRSSTLVKPDTKPADEVQTSFSLFMAISSWP